LIIDGEPADWSGVSAVPIATARHIAARHDRERRWTVVSLGAASLGMALLCGVPAVRDILAQSRATGTLAAPGWSCLVLLMSLIQLALALYSVQLPDWSTTWIVALATMGIAAAYALGLGLSMFAAADNVFLFRLGLVDEQYHGTAQRWCFLVLCVALLLAYSYGRFSIRWHQLHARLAGDTPEPIRGA
jgi:hypothetical protein